VSETILYDVMILGGGPAGMTAGIYAARGGLKAVIIEKASPGGQIAITPHIENYPGFETIGGLELAFKMKQQCEFLGVEFIFDSVVELELLGSIKYAITSYSGKFEAKSVIIATGASPRPLGIPRENALVGGGVSYCATCDGNFYKNKPVAVIGGGNTAVEDALYLQNFASEVYLIHRRDSFRADAHLSEKVQESGVKIIWDSVAIELVGARKLEAIKVLNLKTKEVEEIPVNGLFVAVGQRPSSDGLPGVALDGNGYIPTDETLKTNIEGVFAAGDIRPKLLRQVVTAVADGALAADSAIKYLS